MSFRALTTRVVAAVAAVLVVTAAQPVFADPTLPLPIIDIVPQEFFTTGTDTQPQNATLSPPGEGFQLGGTVTLPVFKAFSLSYDRAVGGAFDSALIAVPALGAPPGTIIFPGGAQDLVSTYRGDYHFGGFNLEAGLSNRHRSCCPFNSFEWHKGYVGLSYATPHFSFLNGGFFVFDITGNDSTNFDTPAALAGFAALGITPISKSRVLTTQQAITGIVPIDLKHGVRVAGTWLWGALDYAQNTPFPYYYNVLVMSGTKQFTDNFGLTAAVTNVTQRNQGYPFAAPSGVHTIALALTADLHLDFSKYITTSPQKGRSTTPGVPGGPGGPAPVGPTQGGAVSPAPGASSMPATQPTTGPAPMMSPAPSPTP